MATGTATRTAGTRRIPAPATSRRVVDPDEDDGPDGRAVRAAKDEEGRHAGVYGAPGREYQEKARSGEAEPPKKRPVSASQGSRSFGAGLGKRRAL